MKPNQNDQDYEVNFYEWSIHTSDDDINMLEPDPETIMQLRDDEEDEISDYTRMEKAIDQGYIG